MKPRLTLIFSILACLLLAAAAYFAATGLISALENFRSPLAANPPTPGEPLGLPATRRVVFVLVDALRYDTSLKSDVMPSLDALRSKGASAVMYSQAPSYSDPGWATLLIGGWPYLNDAHPMNAEYANTRAWTQDNLFTAATRSGMCSAVSGFDWFEKLIPAGDYSMGFFTPGEDDAADRAVMAAALPWLEDPSCQFVLIHLDQVDYAGHHEGGPQDPRWDAAASRVDAMLGQIAAGLDFTQDTLVVVSDHGQIDAGGHGGADAVTLTEPFVMVGKGVIPGVYADIQMVDVAPTLAALLGLSLPASGQGRALTEMLDLPEGSLQRLPALEQAQQAQLLEKYSTAIGVQAPQPAGESVAAYQAALQAARTSRMQREALWRTLMVLPLLLIPLFVLWLKRKAQTDWLVLGALIFTALFHLRFALVDRRAYSFSAISGVTDLLVYVGMTTFIALLLAWLVVGFGTRLFLQTPRQAAQGSLWLVLVTLYVTLLPAVWNFILNGFGAAWTTPQMTAAFWGLLALIQVLFTAGIGLLLAGMAALAARFTKNGSTSSD